MDNTISRSGDFRSRERGEKSDDASGGDEIGAFSKMLEERSSKLEGGMKEEHHEEIYSDKKEKAKAEEEERLKKLRAAKDGMPLSMKAMIHDLSLKDRDILSLSQKQTLGFNADGAAGVSADEFHRMMSSRNLKLNDMNMHQLSQLMQRSSKEQITSFLDHMVNEQRKAGGENVTGNLAGAASGTASEGSAPADPSLADLKAERTEAERNVKREEVIKQIIQHAELRDVGNRTELSLKLNPEYLGDMKLKLILKGDEVTAEFNTVSPYVRKAIEESHGELFEALASQGIKVGKISVNLVDKVV
ncbi:MAG: flagellar hook-length control protein FliK [Candidatus Xenobiia bacterium LiM19]